MLKEKFVHDVINKLMAVDFKIKSLKTSQNEAESNKIHDDCNKLLNDVFIMIKKFQNNEFIESVQKLKSAWVWLVPFRL